MEFLLAAVAQDEQAREQVRQQVRQQAEALLQDEQTQQQAEGGGEWLSDRRKRPQKSMDNTASESSKRVCSEADKASTVYVFYPMLGVQQGRIPTAEELFEFPPHSCKLTPVFFEDAGNECSLALVKTHEVHAKERGAVEYGIKWNDQDNKKAKPKAKAKANAKPNAKPRLSCRLRTRRRKSQRQMAIYRK